MLFKSINTGITLDVNLVKQFSLQCGLDGTSWELIFVLNDDTQHTVYTCHSHDGEKAWTYLKGILDDIKANRSEIQLYDTEQSFNPANSCI